MKAAASLTAALLARKGNAAPFGAQGPGANGAIAVLPQAADGGTLSVYAPAEGARRVAMTLRLDPQRHLRLRLLSALAGRSCQALLIEALDGYLAEKSSDLDSHALRCLRQTGIDGT
ncbi:MAG: hypothetical protein ACOY99_10420 [Pseudomonadota bacterium]